MLSLGLEGKTASCSQILQTHPTVRSWTRWRSCSYKKKGAPNFLSVSLKGVHRSCWRPPLKAPWPTRRCDIGRTSPSLPRPKGLDLTVFGFKYVFSCTISSTQITFAIVRALTSLHAQTPPSTSRPECGAGASSSRSGQLKCHFGKQTCNTRAYVYQQKQRVG